MSDVDDPKTVSALLDLVEMQRAKIEELDTEREEHLQGIQDLEERIQGIKLGWYYHRDSKEKSNLPSPRLEICWNPDPEFGWGDYTVEYRMVMTHLCNHEVIIPLGKTTIQGGRYGDMENEPPPYERDNFPIRDGAHAFHDSVHLGLPLYAVTPTRPPVRLDNDPKHMKNYENQCVKGLKHRVTP